MLGLSAEVWDVIGYALAAVLLAAAEVIRRRKAVGLRSERPPRGEASGARPPAADPVREPLSYSHAPERGIDSSLGSLHPEFRRRVQRVVEEMRALGHDAVIWETGRSAERARELAARGTGIERSMHRIGLAADVVSRRSLWRAPEGFWFDLRRLAGASGLTTLATDRPHLQAIPVSAQRGAWEAAERGELDEYVRERLS